MITITPRSNFTHVGAIPSRFDQCDPRQPLHGEDSLHIDLRECEFIRPSAVLWCAVFGLLAKQAIGQCEVLVPQNMGVCVYLKSAGLFNILKSGGVAVDDRDLPDRVDPQLVLSLSQFESQADAEELANKALDALTDRGLGAANLHPLVSEMFAEVALNAVEHAESAVHAFGLIQFYSTERGERFVCVVADGGIGIRRSLERNPALRQRVSYDWDAIELALRERVSGTADKTRGIGLYGVAEDMRRAGRHLIIHSGIGSVRISEDVQMRATRTRLFPGTLAYLSIPC